MPRETGLAQLVVALVLAHKRNIKNRCHVILFPDFSACPASQILSVSPTTLAPTQTLN